MPWASLVLAQSSPPPSPAPFYVTSSIVNAANYRAELLAPNTIATLYGKDLAYVSRGVTPDDLRGDVLPVTLIGTGVKLSVGNIAAPILYVSPGQVNFVVPSVLPPGEVEVRLVVDSRFGPAVKIKLAEVSPALFPLDPEFAIATRADGSLITREAPAQGGEIVILYATGLGQTKPRVAMGQIVKEAAVLERIADFRVWLNRTELSAESVLYAGVAPGFAGLYQINLQLPRVFDRNPEIQIGFGAVMSPTGVRLLTE